MVDLMLPFPVLITQEQGRSVGQKQRKLTIGNILCSMLRSTKSGIKIANR